MSDDHPELDLPETCLPEWSVADLPEPEPIRLKQWHRFIGPGIVMCGIQIGGGEWLYGPSITATYGGALMWIATVAIIVQSFYNLEAGRYAIYSGEPIFTGFMRLRPGPAFWITGTMLLSVGALIPGLASHAATIIAAFFLDRPPGPEDQGLVMTIGYATLAIAILPTLVGGKIYNMLQYVMTAKVVIVLGFCLLTGLLFVTPENWANVFVGFLRFGEIPVDGPLEDGLKPTRNIFTSLWSDGTLPIMSLANIAALGAFAGYAGGGGLSNSSYSNFVRDKGWGMGKHVGAIASAVGGRDIKLSHIGTVFPPNEKNLKRWKGWWGYIKRDQLIIWLPGCLMGMALPALLSMQFSSASSMMIGTPEEIDEARRFGQAVITADGMRQALGNYGQLFWSLCLLVGLCVFLPSQMSIVENFARRWTDIIWSGSKRVRTTMKPHQANRVYYTILAAYVFWSFTWLTIFLLIRKPPALMTDIIANLNNLALGATAILLWRVNTRLLPQQIQPRWYNKLGLWCCAAFYLGLFALVAVKIVTQYT